MQYRILAALRPLLLILATALPALAQGSDGFENGLTGWTADPPSNVTLATPPIPAGLFPTEGDTYAVLRSNGRGDANPGYGPHPTGTGSFGPAGQADTGDGFVSKLSRPFTRPVGAR